MKCFKKSQVFFLILISLLISIDILPQAAELDTTFGQSGIVTTAINVRGGSQLYSTAIRGDGKIVAAGYFGYSGDNDFALVRYNTDGSLDYAFGTGGIVTTPLGSPGDRAYSLTIQNDGKVLVAGTFDNGSDKDIAIVRYNLNGSLDNTFGTNGIVTTPFQNSTDYAYSVCVQSDGKVIVAGTTYSSGDDGLLLLRYNANGALDNTFGTNGISIIPVGAVEDIAHSIIILSDGKIVLAGSTWNGSDRDFVIVRCNMNGTLDNTFGTGGIITTPVSTSDDYIYSASLQSDGKIVVAGFMEDGDNGDIIVARYHPNGALDNTFGTNGIVITTVGSSNNYAFSVSVQTDGKLVVGGYFWNGSDNDIAVIRYNTDGTLDNSFGINGIVTVKIGTLSDFARSIVLQSDGKIVVAGYSEYEIFNNNGAIIRLNNDGSLDNTFGSFGQIITRIGISESIASMTKIQSDGKIVVAGYSDNGSDYDFAITRYNSDGSLDDTFGSYGIVTSPVGTSDDYANSLAIQNDGKILVAGYTLNSNGSDFVVARYNPNGFLDNTFGTNGVIISNIGSSIDRAYSVAVQNDDKIVVAGFLFNGNNFDFAIVRYNSDGAIDNTFGTNGIVTTSIGALNDFILSVIVQADGKIVTAGYADSGNDFDFAVARYNGDGTLDNTFGTNGTIITQIGTSDDYVRSASLQSDGKILVAGYSDNGNDDDIALVRYNTDGTVDNMFGTDGIVTTQVGVLDDRANSVVMQSSNGKDEKIVVAGFSEDGSDRALVVLRYNYDGSLDDTFGADGVISTKVGASQYSIANSAALQGGGEIVVAGHSGSENYRVFTLIRYTGDPATGISEESTGEIPTDFALLQNYPNPFNPTTKIEIVIPKSSFVNLKVYDVLGKEVSTLVNEEKPAGVYKVNFYAAGLSSGIYFYRLRVGEFVQTKKMLLLR